LACSTQIRSEDCWWRSASPLKPKKDATPEEVAAWAVGGPTVIGVELPCAW
jgi:hypothetical protein